MLDQILWFMGNPQPVAVSGVARTEIAHQQGAFSSWDRSAIADSFDVEDFAAAFVRFENGATLILEVSWLLHGQDSSQVWLYGSKGGCHWPSCTFFESNYQTQQHYDRELKLTDSTSMFVRECCEFARTIALGEPSPVPAEQSLQVMEILDGIYRSQKTGREVSIE
jgi:predicted dehydrogenase